MSLSLLRAIFSHLYTGQATDPHQAVGGITSANVHRTLSLDSSGNLNVNAAAGSITVTQPVATTATLTNVNDSNSNQTLLAANSARLQATIFNDSDQNLFVKFGTTASSTSFTVKMLPGAYYELPNMAMYTGRIDGIWAADSTGAARITELTA